MDPLEADADLPICTLCGTQYPAEQDREHCPVCEDPRQWTKETGQEWTSLRQLTREGHKWELVPDKEDKRLSFIKTTPSIGIGQCPMLIETSQGSYIWDCSAYIDQALVDKLKKLRMPLKAIIISHPHFYSTSLNWSRALGVPLVLAAADKEWYMRRHEVSTEIEWFENVKEVGPGVTVIRCGGHFPGSSVLVWDRSVEPEQADPSLPRSSIAFVADTLFVQPTQRGFTYPWSVPNLIPLGPPAIVNILNMLWQGTGCNATNKRVPFEQATSSWSNRWIRQDAWKAAEESAVRQLSHMGWTAETVLRRDGGQDEAGRISIRAGDFVQELRAYEEEFAQQGKL